MGFVALRQDLIGAERCQNPSRGIADMRLADMTGADKADSGGLRDNIFIKSMKTNEFC